MKNCPKQVVRIRVKGTCPGLKSSKSVILFWLLNVTIYDVNKSFSKICAAHSPIRLDIETKFLISNY